jgi:hypothetical protein
VNTDEHRTNPGDRNPKRERTASVITSGGKRNPAKPDVDTGTRREQRRIDQACLILLSTDATDPRCTLPAIRRDSVHNPG